MKLLAVKKRGDVAEVLHFDSDCSRSPNERLEAAAKVLIAALTTDVQMGDQFTLSFGSEEESDG